MPLSEQEQRLLDEMERHLMGNDADVVGSSQGHRSLSYRNIVYGTILVLVGLAVLVVGVANSIIPLGVVAFVVMLVGVVVAITPLRSVRPGSRAANGAAPAAKKPAARSSFLDRMNDRWDRRQEGR